MDCRRSTVDDDRSRRTRAVDEDRRRIRWADDEDRHRRRWAIDDDRRRRRREIDDYPPLELPLQWRDPPPEYPPLELPLKWRNPFPDHLVRNQPAAFVRDSPPLRPHLVAHDPSATSSRNHTRNPDPLIQDFDNPHENGHRRRRDVDRAQCWEALRLAQVESSIDQIDALCVNIMQSVERIMSRPATIPSPSLLCSTNTQAQPNLLPPADSPANNHSVADFDSVDIPIPGIQPDPVATTPPLPPAHTELQLPLPPAPANPNPITPKTQTLEHAGRRHFDSAVYPAPPPLAPTPLRPQQTENPLCSRDFAPDRFPDSDMFVLSLHHLESPLIDPQLSPDETLVAYVKDDTFVPVDGTSSDVHRRPTITTGSSATASSVHSEDSNALDHHHRWPAARSRQSSLLITSLGCSAEGNELKSTPEIGISVSSVGSMSPTIPRGDNSIRHLVQKILDRGWMEVHMVLADQFAKSNNRHLVDHGDGETELNDHHNVDTVNIFIAGGSKENRKLTYYGPTATIEEQGIKELDMRPGGISSLFLITDLNGKDKEFVMQWLELKPNFSVQYIGLSSWDKHVEYKNITILPLTQHHTSLWSQVGCKEYQVESGKEFAILDIINDGLGKWELPNFFESWDLSNVMFIVGAERKIVHAHKVILNAYGDFSSQTKVVESQFDSLRDLSVQFQVLSLIKRCNEISDSFKTEGKLFDSEDTVCPILVAIASLPSCKVVEETCKRKISMHFDYCTTAEYRLCTVR
ncbi:BTB/POZ domain-containing protein [Dendrobium catenatum]|uniref:BTB/POZ domain-containing protein n=1 Tax=Dendrobium catenatum TaxID=906689 RepID=A0A2I0WQT7_9ASPA|nr:BTB/POZ domain-containing protein [Dendrobium catenatum]